jgi:hypothetical protein
VFVGDDWHLTITTSRSRTTPAAGLAKPACPTVGLARLHDLLAEHLPADAGSDQVLIGIETPDGPWDAALIPTGYQVRDQPPPSSPGQGPPQHVRRQKRHR